jgi:hypothetical protein
MEYFAGLDVSMAETHVCVVTRTGRVTHKAKVPSTLPISRPSSRNFRLAGVSYSRRAEWRRCSSMA